MLDAFWIIALTQVWVERPSVDYSRAFESSYWQRTHCDDVIPASLPTEPVVTTNSLSGIRTATLVRTLGTKVPYDEAQARLRIDGIDFTPICLRTVHFRNLVVRWNGDSLLYLGQNLGHVVNTEELFDVEARDWALQRTASYVKGRIGAPMNASLRDQLLAMRERDLRVRAELAATGELFEGYHPRMALVHAEHAEALQRIIDEHGWPGRTLVGVDGAEAAWLVLQHAVGQPALLRSALPLLKQAVEAGEIAPANVAHLEDRILALGGQPQIYGTHFDWDDDGELSPSTLRDPDDVDRLRASVGLGPLAERIAEIRAEASAEGQQAPADLGEWRRGKRAWAVSVGWIEP